eukprot:TRINITY_DN27609_c0_g1_i2.p1 TRINITY_DN27609_c0_g1~~TRINITY_DN27609_c0_g1_i2.p1  ORF type:complete len:238 (-),score=40.85 TRINITY_DN27609_c0_g1_i2:177-830(-)
MCIRDSLYSAENPKRQDVIIARINGEYYRDVSGRYGVWAYPTIVLFRAGSQDVYSRFELPFRIVEKFSEWIESSAGPEIRELVEEEIKESERVSAAEPEGHSETVGESEKGEKDGSYEIVVNVDDERGLEDYLQGFEERLGSLEERNKENFNTFIKEIKNLKEDSEETEIVGGKGTKVFFFMIGGIVGMGMAIIIIRIKTITGNKAKTSYLVHQRCF